jgi:aldehyde:ferredoxin oxidoreductase
MRTSFGETRNDPSAVFYTRCTLDLASGSHRVEEMRCRNLEDVLGGFGRSFQTLAERQVTNAYSPENPLIVATGVLTGSTVMTALRTYFCSYSPLKVSEKGMPSAFWATGSGNFGSKFRWAGLDELILEGRAAEPVMVVVKFSEQGPLLELKPAGHLRGLHCNEKIQELHREFPAAHFAVIGPGGENYENCYYGAVALSTDNQLRSGDDKCRFAGRGGMGSVLGYKNVLAIVADAPDRLGKLTPLVRDINKEVATGPGSRKLREKSKGGLGGTWANYDILEKFYFVPQNNFRPKGDDKAKLMMRDAVEPNVVIKAESCFRCGISCHKNIYDKNPDGTRGRFRAKFDYEPVNLLSTNLGIHNADQNADLIIAVDSLGMDNISLGTTIAYVLDYNERHPDKPILNGATFGDFDKVRELIRETGEGRCSEIGHGVKRLSRKLGETGYAMHSKGVEYPAYQPDTNPGYPWAIAGGHMSMATHLIYALERDSSLEYWVKAITERGLLWIRDDLIGLCKFSGVSPDNIAAAIKEEIGLEVTGQELIAATRRAFVRGLWLERRQGFERSDYVLPDEVFDRPNDKLGLPNFVTREFFAQLSERVWAIFDKEIAEIAS